MQYHRYGHAKEHFVKLGDKVKKGQKILSIGTGNGQWSAHCHYDQPMQKLADWTGYVFGMTVDKVRAQYADPTKDIKTVMPEYDHMGFGYLEHANYGTASKPNYCYHPGVDLNGKGAGNADLGDPIYSACDGIVVFDYDDTGLDHGWGRLLVIQETTLNPVPAPNVSTANPEPKQDEVVPVPVTVAPTPPELIADFDKASGQIITEPTQTYANLGKTKEDSIFDWIIKIINLILNKWKS
jgi:hypothetical protein